MVQGAANRILVLLALVSAAILIVAILRRPAGPTESSVESATEVLQPAADAASVLSDPERSASSPESAPRVADPAANAEPSEPAQEQQTRALRLVGSLRSTPVPSLPIELVVDTIESTTGPLRFPVASAQSVDVLLPASLLESLRGGRELRMWAENAGLRTREHRARFKHAKLRHAENETSEYLLPLDLEFVPFSTVSGSVVESTSSPLAGATVAVFGSTSANQAPDLLATQIAREDGSFRFDLEYCGTIAVVAYFERFTTATQNAKLPCDGRLELSPLRLTRGVCISGVLRAGTRDRTVVGTSVSVRPTAKRTFSSQFFVGRAHFEWTANGLQPNFTSANTDDEGAFEFCGLLAGAYSVSADGPPHGCMLGGVTGRSVEVIAPVEGVVIDVAYPVLRVSVTHDGEPIPRAFVKLSPVDSDVRCPADFAGIAEIGVLPNVQYTAEVVADGFESTEIPIVPLAPGEVRLERARLRRLALGGTLKIKIVTETREMPERVCVVFERVVDGASIPASRFSVEQSVIGGTATITQVPHDRYRVAVRAMGCDDTRSMLAPDVFEDDIRSGETLEREVGLARGGRLHVRVQAPDGSVLPAVCWVEVGRGLRWPLQFVSVRSGSASANLRPGDLTQSLGPDEYVLRCELDGYHPLESAFTIRAGEVERKTVTLIPLGDR